MRVPSILSWETLADHMNFAQQIIEVVSPMLSQLESISASHGVELVAEQRLRRRARSMPLEVLPTAKAACSEVECPQQVANFWRCTRL